MEIVVAPPRLQVWDRRHIFVTHDECIFYSNDAKKTMWLEDGEGIIRQKGQGGSVMISDFLCPCHGAYDWIQTQPRNSTFLQMQEK